MNTRVCKNAYRATTCVPITRIRWPGCAGRVVVDIESATGRQPQDLRGGSGARMHCKPLLPWWLHQRQARSYEHEGHHSATQVLWLAVACAPSNSSTQGL